MKRRWDRFDRNSIAPQLIVLLLVCLFALQSTAQFYAPETEFHDKAQRLFVVEAARVLAWRENLSGQRIDQISYTVKVEKGGTTAWELDCLDNHAKPVKKVRVSYPQTLLSEGPRYYREVFKQLWSGGNWSSRTNLTASELDQRFWDGADLNGMAREEGLRAAFRLVRTNASLSEAVLAPELAGLLSQVPMPSLCGGVTMDAMLLARGSAWLALSELMLADGSSASDENWAPILFMAGRENAACALWQANVSLAEAEQNGHTLFRWWDFFLRRPKAREAFAFVADPKQRRFGMPMMTYYSRLEYLGSQLAAVLPLMYGDGTKSLSKLYNFGAFVPAATDVSGGRILEGAWPAIFRQEWRKTLKDLPPLANDYTGYTEKLNNVSSATLESQPQEEDPSLAGLKQVAPLLQLGYTQGVGKLIPTPAVTARDLLNYGWEMNGLQMGSRYFFVRERWGVPDLARTILNAATRDIEGQMAFFKSDLQQRVFNLQETRFRLQMVDDMTWRSVPEIQPFAKDMSDTNAATTFVRRCWLRPYEVRLQAWSLGRVGLYDEMFQLLQRYHSDCGLKSDVIILEFLSSWSSKQIDMQPGLQSFREQVAEGMIEPCLAQVLALYRKNYAALGNVDRAKVYEKIFWQDPDSGLRQDVLNGYITGGAWKSAKRFYCQTREVVVRDIDFSTVMSPQVWMLGFLTKDEDLMQLALRDSDNGSFFSMMTAIWHCTAHDDFQKAEQQSADLINRYEGEAGPESQGRKIKAFFPLKPALRDKNDPRHETALDHFGKSPTATFFRWILIQKYKLPSEDAVRFLGGEETDRLRRLMVLYLRHANEEQMKAAYFDYMTSATFKGAARTIGSWIVGQPQKLPPTITQEDLKPKDVKSIRQAVLEKLQAQ